MKKTGLYGYIFDFSVDSDGIDVDEILDFQKYLMEKHDIKCDIIVAIFPQIILTGLLFCYEPWMIRHILIDLKSVKLNYPFMIIFDKCNGSCNVVDESYDNKNKWSKNVGKTYFMWLWIQIQ